MKKTDNKKLLSKKEVSFIIYTIVGLTLFLLIILAYLDNDEQFMSAEKKKENATLDAQVTYISPALSILNNEEENWQNCIIRVNGKFNKKISILISGKEEFFPLTDFAASNGEIFNPYNTVVKKVYIAVYDSPDYTGHFRSGAWVWE